MAHPTEPHRPWGECRAAVYIRPIIGHEKTYELERGADQAGRA